MKIKLTNSSSIHQNYLLPKRFNTTFTLCSPLQSTTQFYHDWYKSEQTKLPLLQIMNALLTDADTVPHLKTSMMSLCPTRCDVAPLLFVDVKSSYFKDNLSFPLLCPN